MQNNKQPISFPFCEQYFCGLGLLDVVSLDGTKVADIRESLPGESYRRQFDSELLFHQNRPTQALEIASLTQKDNPFYITSLHLQHELSLRLGDVELFHKTLADLNDLKKNCTNENMLFLIDIALINSKIRMLDVGDLPDWFCEARFPKTYPNVYLSAMLAYARYLFIVGNYQRAVGICDAMSEYSCFSTSSFMLNVLYSAINIEIKNYDRAKEILANVFEKTVPYNILSMYLTSFPLISSEIKQVLSEKYSKHYKVMWRSWQDGTDNLIDIMNEVLGRSITKGLTLRERQISMKLSEGISYAEIADIYKISPNTVNNIIQKVKEKSKQTTVRSAVEINTVVYRKQN